MKTAVSRKLRKLGNTILAVLIICSALAVTVMGYLSVIEQQNLLSGRSQAWNIAIAIVEAGLEDGLQHLNSNRTNLLVDGWGYSGGHYVRSNTLPDGNSYTVAISISNAPKPTIVSQAYVSAPVSLRQGSGSMFASIGSTAPSPAATLVSRAVQVRCYKPGVGGGAMAARKQINLNGNNVLTDSFNSSDPSGSTGHLYDPAKARDRGDVLSNDSVINTISVGNANIYGHVSTGPGGTVAINQGGVGSHAWQASNKGFQDDWVTHDANFTFPEVKLPYTSGLTPASGDIVETSLLITTNNSTTSTWPNPPPWDGVTSNIVSTTTVMTYPDPPRPMTTTNVTWVTISAYPNLDPSILIKTNSTTVNNSSTYPDPAPSGVTTNVTMVYDSTTYPVPTPLGVTTNYITRHVKKAEYPAPGTYVGTVTPRGNEWEYDEIVGYTYNYPTYTYNYPVYSYTYAKYSYTYPNFTYSYHLFTTNIVYSTNHYDHILYTGDYYLDAPLTGSTIVLGKANLVVANGVNMSGSDVFKVGENGSVNVYSGGTTVAVGGKGIINQSGYAANFILWATDTVTTMSLNGNGSIIGVFVARNADTTMNGTGSSTAVDFSGSLLVNSVKMNGRFNFHYDEALDNADIGGRYLISSWDELKVASR